METKVTTRLKSITYKKDKLDMLNDNIQIRVISFGWEEFETKWFKGARQIGCTSEINSRVDL